MTATDAAYSASLPTAAPPQLAWGFVTEPGRRIGWQTGTTEILVSNATGGRRGVGTTNHCMDGKDAVIEEILDWRPYDYVTERATMSTPMGPLKFVTTTELEPTPAGTIVHFRFALPKSAGEQAIMREMAPAMTAMVEHHGTALAAQLAAELRAGPADGAEPDLPTPRSDGVLASISRAGPS